jgi:formylglycine-generating enzyme required for sulfatase activity
MGFLGQLRILLGVVTVVILGLLSLRSDAAQEVRVALVIGNTDYANTRDLPNAVRDAALVGTTLTKVGFSVTPLTNLSQADMTTALRNFLRTAATADVALVYYAGHGIEVDGVNYLVPVDALLGSPDEVRFGTIPLDLVMNAVQKARRLKLVVLDSCRDNPFKPKWDTTATPGGSRSTTGGRGLAPIQEPPSDTLVAYAARAGSTAADGNENDNSPFAKALTRRMAEPGAEVSIVFRRVRDDVLAETGNTQEPFTYGSLSGQEFYFVPKGARLAAGPDPAAAKKPGESFRDCPDCPEMVVVPPGSFMMGSPETEAGREKDEGPQRRVTITKAFAVGRLEITRAQYAAFATATGRDTPSSCYVLSGSEVISDGNSNWRTPSFSQTDAHPVVCVNWEEAQAYVQWLSAQTGRRYRLLSEAEWEYAARAGTTTPFIWGDDPNAGCAQANGADKTAQGQLPSGFAYSTCDDGAVYTAPAGRYAPNKFGLRDMIGNAWEWTEDCYNQTYTGAPTDGSPWRTGDCGRRVLRGGSWFISPLYLRSAFRSRIDPSVRSNGGGFRVARTL